jgi:NADH-quinone oxidoreductase subunit J
MLIQVRTEGRDLDRLTLQKPTAILFVLALLGQGFLFMRSAVANLRPPDPAVPDEYGGIEEIGRELFTTYLLPFELTSVLLLVAVVGAVVLAKRVKAEGGSE